MRSFVHESAESSGAAGSRGRSRALRGTGVVLASLALAALSCAGGVSAVPGTAAHDGREREEGIWISRAEISLLPMEGPAWNSLRKVADQSLGTPMIREHDDNVDVQVLAKALVYVRTENDRYKQEVVKAIGEAMGSEIGGDVLALGRNLPGYVIAADLVGLPPALERSFRAWLANVRMAELDGKTLIGVHERRPNNWGTHAGGARAVVARYLEDWDDLDRVAQIFKGWLGDRSSYAGFEYGELSWQFDPDRPVGINPEGATKNGHSIDGVLPDDQRRGGSFFWPPPHVNYVYEALQGVLLQAAVLHRAGYDCWAWENRAILRAFRWLEEVAGYPATGDDTWQPHMINSVYEFQDWLTAPVPSRPGKNVGWTDWTARSEATEIRR